MVPLRVLPLCAPGRRWFALPFRLVVPLLLAPLASWAQEVSALESDPGWAADTLALSAFVVNAQPVTLDEPVASLAVHVTGEELRSRPQAANDVFRALTAMPGVTADDWSAKFWVRGAPNHQVLARLDGIDLLEPYHLKDIDGALSIIDLNTVHEVALSTGGFTAEHGQRLAGVLMMETPTGGQLRPQTVVDASFLSFRGASSGTAQGGRGRWLASFRQGYPELALRLQGRSEQLSPTYYDVTAKYEYEVSPKHVISVHALHASDTLEARVSGSPPLSSRYGSEYLWTRWRGEFGERVSGEAVAFVQGHLWERNADGLLGGSRDIHLRDERRFQSIGARNDWTARFRENAILRGGWEARTSWADYRYVLTQARLPVSGQGADAQRQAVNRAREPWGASYSMYVAPRVQVRPWLVLEPSLRFDQVSHTGDSDWSPRFNLLAGRGATTVRAAWGLYNQPQGLHELAVSDGEQVFHRSEQSEHRILGLEHRLREGLSLRVEAYERRSWQLRPYWENPLNPKGLFPEMLSDRTRFDPSIGRARGIESGLQGSLGRTVRWSAAYAYAEAGEKVENVWFPSARDQRHSLQAHISYMPNERWSFSAAWQGHTGWPVADIESGFNLRSNGAGWAGAVQHERLPDYHRLDLRVVRTYRPAWGEVQVFVDVFNAYDRANVLGYEPGGRNSGGGASERKPIKLFPILPNVGLTCRF